jgi:hypothetical protein
VIEPKELTESFAMAKSREFLLENRDEKFAHLIMLSDKADVRMIGMGQTTKPRPLSFQFWQATYRTLASRKSRTAEVIRIGSNSVVRFTDGGEPKLLPMDGTNPLEVSPPWLTQPIRIVLIRFSEEFKAQAYQETDIKDLTVFCETRSALDEATGLKLVAYLESLWGLGRVEVVLRTDDLFAADPYFPWRHLFASDKRWLELPSLDAYDASPSLICGRQRSGPMGCRVRTFGGSIGYRAR